MKHLFIALFAASLVSCSNPSSSTGSASSRTTAVTTEQPVSQGGTTVREYDWEKSTELDTRASFAPSSIESTKTLEQTTTWLRWALERYGHTHPTIYDDDITDVRFRACTMEWTETQKQDGVTPVARYSLSLGDISLERGAVQYFSSDVRVRVAKNSIIVSTRYFENGKEKEGGPREEHEPGAQLPLKEQDNINARVAFAIVHAAQLCGAQPPVYR